ncbi:MAG: Hint domain-containing protein, partial [Paracoccaceae bacterium]|nr:Hint domain-containing protein [Paracoccaceae bacterium]
MMTPDPTDTANFGPDLGSSSAPGHVAQVFAASDIYVTLGVNLGDGLGMPDDIGLGDIFELDAEARPGRLVMARDAQGQRVAQGSDLGQPGAALTLAARYTLMAPDGNRVELLLICQAQPPETRFVLPLSPIGAGIEYTLVRIEDAPKDARLSDLLCVSFARGTMITLADGAQCRIEDLRAGDKVLTRDHGPQPLSWIGQATLRAVGAFAPVVITRGTLGNAGDLIVSQHHRMFLYQRDRRAGVKTAEVLVQAKHLTDGETIFLREGGFVDYFSLVFARHEIIYA